MSTSPTANPKVLLSTSHGDITIELDAVNAPISAQNFLSYVDEKAYDGTIFHRVIDGFMIQGGAFTPDMKQRTGRSGIKNEWKNGLKNLRGTLAMARLGGKPDSGSNQFFINVKDNGFLDQPQSDGAAYAVFGKVIAGLEVVDKIRVVRTGNKAGHQDVPMETITVTSAKRV